MATAPKLTQADFVERSEALHGKGRYDYSQTVFEKAHLPITVICPKPKHGPFTISQANTFYLRGQGCPECRFERTGQRPPPPRGATRKAPPAMTSNRRPEIAAKMRAAFIAKCEEALGHTRYDWSLLEHAPGDRLRKVKVICPDHGVFEATQQQIRRDGTGCRTCWLEQSRTTAKANFILKAEAVHGVGRYDLSKANYTDDRGTLKVICPVTGHGLFKRRASEFLYARPGKKAHGCPKCGRVAQRELIDAIRARMLGGPSPTLETFQGIAFHSTPKQVAALQRAEIPADQLLDTAAFAFAVAYQLNILAKGA